jgi:hypothetical protein
MGAKTWVIRNGNRDTTVTGTYNGNRDITNIDNCLTR